MKLVDTLSKERNLTGFLAVVLILSCFALIWSGLYAYQSYTYYKSGTDRLMRIGELRGTILHVDEVLTMSAYLAAVTGDLQWEQRYHEFEPLLETAIDKAITFSSDANEGVAALKTEAANITLVKMENQVFGLVREGQKDNALALLSSDEYIEYKQIYARGMNEFTEAFSSATRDQWKLQQRGNLLYVLFMLVLLPCLMVSWFIIFRILNKWWLVTSTNNHQLAQRSEELIDLNRTLDSRVIERTTELSIINESMIREIDERKLAEEKFNKINLHLNAIIESEPECVKTVAKDGSLLSMNPAGLLMVEASSFDEIEGISVYKFVAPEYRDKYRDLHKRVLEGESVKLEFEIIGLKGKKSWLETHATPLFDNSGEIRAQLAVTRDITEQKQIEVLKSDQQHILELISHGNTSITDIFEKVIELTQKQLPYTRTTILYVIDNKLKHAVASQMSDAYNKLVDGLEIGPRVGSCGTAAYCKQRVIVTDVARDPLWADYKQLGLKYDFSACWSEPIFDINGEVVATFALYSHNSEVPAKNEIQLIEAISNLISIAIERKRADEKLSYQASHDSLTGLVNRGEFEQRIGRLLVTTKEDSSEHALCFLDLDQFKVVNDTYGHIAGDEMLRQLSLVLNNTVRHRDTLARLGGDEFGVLMEHCSLDDAHRVAMSILIAIQDYPFLWEGQSFTIGVSIGLVSITDITPNITELLKSADAACYMAKDQGRNRIHVYNVDDAELAQRHGEMQWVTRLTQALEEDRFCLYAQAIVPLDSSMDKHYELLIRMIDEKDNVISPGDFLPAAERYNLISKIDRWVIKNAFTLLKNNPEFLKQINFCSINLSGQSITEKDFLDFIVTQLDKSGIEGKYICFEITETAAISNLNKATEFISVLKGLGCKFALDDFGSGLSSFGYLKNLPVDYLKIDGMFVKDIIDDPIDYAMVKSINEIGQVMGMQIIAEFVENDEIKNMLEAIGVNYGQGYGLGKPYSFEKLLERSNNVIEINFAMENK